MLKFHITTSFVAIQEGVVHDLVPSPSASSSSSSNYNTNRNRGGKEQHEDDDDDHRRRHDGPLGKQAHATTVRSKAECLRQFETGIQR